MVGVVSAKITAKSIVSGEMHLRTLQAVVTAKPGPSATFVLDTTIHEALSRSYAEAIAVVDALTVEVS